MLGISVLRGVMRRVRRVPGAVLVLDPIRKFLTRFVSSVNADDLIEDFDGDLKLRLNLLDEMGSQIYWYGTYNRDILSLMGRLLAPDQVFVDVGANIGEVSLFAAKRVGSRGTVLAFEPFEKVAVQLEASRRLNGLEQLRIFRQGLAQTPTHAQIFLETAGPSHGASIENRGAASLYPVPGATVQDEVELTTLDLETTRLGLERLDGIKIDIEGGELPALKGARATLERFRPWIICELQAEGCERAGYKMSEIIEYLEGLGYVIDKIGRHGSLAPLGALDDFQNIFCQHSSHR